MFEFSIPREFMEPLRLWWLLVLPVLGGMYWVLLKQRESSYRRRGSDRLARVLPRQSPWKRHVAVVAAVLSLASLIAAYARPKGYVLVPRERATVVLVMDVSLSMAATDVSPNRKEAAQDSAKEFVDMLPKGFNVSFVTFAGTANMLTPPTNDRNAVKASIDEIKLAPSTAIGEGIYTGLKALNYVPEDPNNKDGKPPAVIVLLSDGGSNLPRPSKEAAAEAKRQNVPVYTIAYGTPGGYIIGSNGDRSPVPVNHYELKQVSDISGGEKLEAQSKSDLQKVYKQIASSIGYEKQEKETTDQFIGMGLLCAVIASLGVISIAARWP